MGLTIMIILQVILWFIGFFVRGGITLYQILLIIPVIMFSIRKFGVKVSAVNIVVTEILFLFFSTVFTILFSEIVTSKYVICLLIRMISCIIAIIDDVMYVYVTEERKVK